ncbi:Beta-galactosidase [Hondaea fermentalgiana]|uniref:beta-galactosidase n=1 Tax=Hondaea fermentalgiana TaxID=2315210 RepID=A0A2R5GAS7_9STRA|nr:Beta-galactosidase [Hondaea fermentalgiana]|eukprot:GBG26838.1 Beta-galactosidase [Hondaea fermentalgiana]
MVKTAYLRFLNSLRGFFESSGKLEHWQNPQIVYENALVHHTPLRLVSSTEEALAAVKEGRQETEWVRFLATVEDPVMCEFRLFANPASVRPHDIGVYLGGDTGDVQGKKEEEEASWGQTLIPSNWQIEGDEDVPIYTNIKYPWKRPHNLSTRVPSDENPTGVYRLSFDLPDTWQEAVLLGERDVFLILHGAGAGVDIYVNGVRVGYGQDSMTETEVKISHAHLGATNSLVLVIYRWTDGSYLEDQDQWWLSGCFRDIELSCRPHTGGIVDYVVETDPEAASVHVQTRFSGLATDAHRMVLRATLYDANGSKVATQDATGYALAEFSRHRLESEVPIANLTLEVAEPRLWSPRDPYLYTLVLEALDGGNTSAVAIQIESTRVGLRRVDIYKNQLRVNGEPVLVCGVNRHEWSPEHGKSVPEMLMRRDLELMKQFNFNAVRNSHYPNAHRWYELCDEYGMLVVDEANVETHGFTVAAAISLLQCDPKWKMAFLLRCQAMVKRSRNHPCIIGWSLGNESGCGPNARLCAKWIRQVDPTRFVQYEGGIASGDSPLLLGDGRDPKATDIICPMYDSPKRLIEVERVTSRRPIILCEYAHAMGNSNGNLHHYWKLFRSPLHPRMQGGFIWDWVDQGLSKASFLQGEWAYGGDFGPKSGVEDKTFCINGLCFPDRTPHPSMHEAKYLQQPAVITFGVRKDFDVDAEIVFEAHAPPLNALAVHWSVLGVASAVPLASGRCYLEKSGNVNGLPSSAALAELAEGLEGLRLRVYIVLARDMAYAPQGHEVAFEECVVGPAGRLCHDLGRVKFSALTPPPSPSGASGGGNEPDVTAHEGRFEVRLATYTVEFDAHNGRILSVMHPSGVTVLESGGFGHAFFRAPTDNDLGGLDSMLPYEFLRKLAPKSGTSYNGLWRKLGLDALHEVTDDLQIETLSQSVQVKVCVSHFHGKRPRFRTKTMYTFANDGIYVTCDVEADSSVVNGCVTLPRIGMVFVAPGEFDQVEYLGRGPHETYPDRKASAPLGVYECEVDAMHVPYIKPSECGGRADVQWAAFRSRGSGRGFRISHASPTPVRREVFPGVSPKGIEMPGPSARPTGMSGAQLNVSRYTVDDLATAKHQSELPDIDRSSPLYIHIDTAHMGLGGDVSWQPRTHDQYKVHSKGWKYRLKIEII